MKSGFSSHPNNDSPTIRLQGLRARVDRYRDRDRTTILIAWAERAAADQLVKEGILTHIQALEYRIK